MISLIDATTIISVCILLTTTLSSLMCINFFVDSILQFAITFGQRYTPTVRWYAIAMEGMSRRRTTWDGSYVVVIVIISSIERWWWWTINAWVWTTVLI